MAQVLHYSLRHILHIILAFTCLCESGGGSSGFTPAPTRPDNAPPNAEIHAPFVVCHCGKEAVIRTSRQPNSYGDTFYGCSLGKSGCNFFSWCYMHVRTQHAARRATEAAFTEREREREEQGRNGGERSQQGRSGLRPITPSMRALLNARTERTNAPRASAGSIDNRACVERHRNPPRPVCVVQHLLCQRSFPVPFFPPFLFLFLFLLWSDV
jgi:hypothetical protein